MRKLADAATKREAEHLLDRLHVADIDAQLRGEQPPWEVWVLDERDMPAAKQCLETLASGGTPEPARKPAPPRRQPVERRGAEAPGGANAALGVGPITAFLIIASVLTALYSGLGEGDSMTVQNLSIEPWDTAEAFGRVRAGEVWRLLTPILIHFGLLHLLFNMSWLWSLGRQIEQHHGSLVLLLLVLVSALPGNVGQYFVSGPNFGGMSGVVYGLFGFVWMQARYDSRRDYHLDDGAAALMMVWFVVCAVGLFGPIANVAHGLGLLAGLLAGMPAYLRHLRLRGTTAEFGAGAWADVHLHGWRRVVRRYYRPFVPLWFLLIAALVTLFG